MQYSGIGNRSESVFLPKLYGFHRFELVFGAELREKTVAPPGETTLACAV